MLTRMPALLLACLLIPMSAAQDTGPQPTQGWKWLLPPTAVDPQDKDSLDGEVPGGKFDFEWDDEKGLELQLEIKFEKQQSGADYEYRGVVFDVDGIRFDIPQSSRSGGSDKLKLKAMLPAATLPTSRIRRLAIEVLSPEDRAAIAAEGQRRARSSGVEVLPLPQTGKPYEFDLATIDGRRVSSAALKGKVVLIDAWATWCEPAMKMRPRLVEFYERNRGAGFEIVGVNFDDSLDVARKAVDEGKLTWPQVYVPDDAATRDLWVASGFENLPRLIVLDRSGTVRALSSPNDVFAEMEKALKSDSAR